LFDFQPSLIYQNNIIIPEILPAISIDAYQMEIKLDILNVFIPHMVYRFVDEVIEVFKLHVSKSSELEGIFVNNINPIMVAA